MAAAILERRFRLAHNRAGANLVSGVPSSLLDSHAASLAMALGVSLDDVAEGLARFRPAFGRFERIPADGRAILMLLVKNPAGANEAVRTLVAGGGPRVA